MNHVGHAGPVRLHLRPVRPPGGDRGRDQRRDDLRAQRHRHGDRARFAHRRTEGAVLGGRRTAAASSSAPMPGAPRSRATPSTPTAGPARSASTATDAGPIDLVASPDGSSLYVETGGERPGRRLRRPAWRLADPHRRRRSRAARTQRARGHRRRRRPLPATRPPAGPPCGVHHRPGARAPIRAGPGPCPVLDRTRGPATSSARPRPCRAPRRRRPSGAGRGVLRGAPPHRVGAPPALVAEHPLEHLGGGGHREVVGDPHEPRCPLGAQVLLAGQEVGEALRVEGRPRAEQQRRPSPGRRPTVSGTA